MITQDINYKNVDFRLLMIFTEMKDSEGSNIKHF